VTAYTQYLTSTPLLSGSGHSLVAPYISHLNREDRYNIFLKVLISMNKERQREREKKRDEEGEGGWTEQEKREREKVLLSAMNCFPADVVSVLEALVWFTREELLSIQEIVSTETEQVREREREDTPFSLSLSRPRPAPRVRQKSRLSLSLSTPSPSLSHTSYSSASVSDTKREREREREREILCNLYWLCLHPIHRCEAVRQVSSLARNLFLSFSLCPPLTPSLSLSSSPSLSLSLSYAGEVRERGGGVCESVCKLERRLDSLLNNILPADTVQVCFNHWLQQERERERERGERERKHITDCK